MLLFMTTNRPENLDKALKRAGRIDKDIYFRRATKDVAGRILSACGLDEPDYEELTHGFKAAIPDNDLTAAEIQGYLIAHSAPEAAVERVVECVEAERVKRNDGNSYEQLRNL